MPANVNTHTMPANVNNSARRRLRRIPDTRIDPMKYTTTELRRARLSDLHVDALCAEADGLADYAARCRAEIAALYAEDPTLTLLDYAATYTLSDAQAR